MRWPILLVTAFAANALAQSPSGPLQLPAAYRIGDGVSAPSVLHKVEPEYSEEARAAEVQGTVVLSLVVDDQGRPQNLKVLRSLELSLDQKAIEAVEQWRFKPGTKDGKAVPIMATIEVNFRLLHTPEEIAAALASTGATSQALAAQGGTAQQAPYVKDGSIGTVKTESLTNNWPQFRYIPLEEWQGKRVIFLPQPGLLRQYGYQSFTGGHGQTGEPTYAEAAGKIGKIIAIERGGFPKVLVEVEGSGARYTGTVYNETLKGIAFLDEIDQARQRLNGKTLWILSSRLSTYDESSDRNGSVKVKKYSPVKVLDIVVGWRNEEPIRLILQSEAGEEGFIDVNISGTNGSKMLVGFSHIDKLFSLVDPKTLYTWPKSIWDVIQDEKVVIGMTREQVKMSWGEPKSISQTLTSAGKSEQWVFGSGDFVYFKEGIVSGIQNQK